MNQIPILHCKSTPNKVAKYIPIEQFTPEFQRSYLDQEGIIVYYESETGDILAEAPDGELFINILKF